MCKKLYYTNTVKIYSLDSVSAFLNKKYSNFTYKFKYGHIQIFSNGKFVAVYNAFNSVLYYNNI